jgi:hypothetical protein
MPFTPLHMGPGIVVKAAMQRHFSLTVFGWSQIVIDIQPLLVMLMDKGELHGFSHTYLGATLIALFCGFSGKYLGEIGLKLIREPKYLPISWRIAFLSAFIGTYSHVFMDSIMHAEITPFYPVSLVNPMSGLISMDTLELLCVVTAVIGGVAFFAIEYWTKKSNYSENQD